MPTVAALAALQLAPPIILVVGVIDFVSAVLTMWALAADTARAAVR
jgi:hypothetical protein